MKIEIIKYPRTCETCDAGMSEGYLVGGGTFCSLKCAGFTEEEWNAHYSDDGDDCWTEWTLEDCDDSEDAQFQAILSKNAIAEELADFKKTGELNANFILRQLRDIETFTGEMNQPSVMDTYENS